MLRRLGSLLFLILLLSGCPQTHYYANLLDVTLVDLRGVKWERTPAGIKIWTPPTFKDVEYYKRVDLEVKELSDCLIKVGLRKEPIRMDWVYVYVPSNWYNSLCSEEQLIPSRISYTLCEKKGLKIDPNCRTVAAPTRECPCPCNARAAVAGGYVIVTAPNLKLLKSELSRLVLYPKYNYPWVAPLNQCL